MQPSLQIWEEFRAAFDGQLPPEVLLRCLFTRKFDVVRAIELVNAYKNDLLPRVDPRGLRFATVESQLRRGELALTGRDRAGAQIIEYFPSLHEKVPTAPDDTLRVALYLMEKGK